MAAGEFELIARLSEVLPPPPSRVRVGSGDDAAVTETRPPSVITVDAIFEGVHFTLPEFPLAAVGRKALAAGLSDLAAMGADPGEAYVVLGVPDDIADEGVVEIAAGLAETAGRYGIGVAGGDLNRATALAIGVTCVGYEPRGGRLVTRAGGRPGDVLVVTGALGGAAAALELLRAGSRAAGAVPSGSTREEILARQLDPRPPLAAGRALAGAGATAMIDISDGLGADAGHLARASGARVEIELARLPVADGVEAVAGGEDSARELAALGGEDFELLAALPPDRLDAAHRATASAGYGLTEIGSLSAGEGVVLRTPEGAELEPRGFDHRRGSRAGAG